MLTVVTTNIVCIIGAIKFVRQSEAVTRVFEGSEHTTKSAQFLLIDGPFLCTRLITEATNRKKVFSFSEKPQFLKLSKLLEQKGLGMLRKITTKNASGRDIKTYYVFYKKPPSRISRADLLRIGVQPQEYQLHFQREHRLSHATKKVLQNTLAHFAIENPYEPTGKNNSANCRQGNLPALSRLFSTQLC